MGAAEKAESSSVLGRYVKRASVILLACGAAVFHYWHVTTMFENDRNFSQISPLEREMSLRTEMGFYYSFYKTLTEEPTVLSGLTKLANDRLVEYPDVINAVNRFNIYPEIMSGLAYHYSLPWLERWRSHCADAMLFYLEGVWWCAGATLAALTLYAAALCGNTWGGLLAAAQYLANHSEATRVQWAPNERENIAQPFLLAQMALVTLQLRKCDQAAKVIGLQTSILILNCICLLFWQFSQYILLTQLAIVFVMEQLCIVSTRKLMLLLHSHYCGLHMALMLTQGNELLMTSLYVAFFLVILTYTLFLSSLRVKNIESLIDLLIETWLVLLRIGIVVTSSIWLKNVLAEVMKFEDDSHIIDILLSKFTNYKTFHTMLYTCSATFAVLPSSYFVKVTKTGLLPLVGIGVSNVLRYWLTLEWKERKEVTKEEELVKEDNLVKKEEILVKNEKDIDKENCNTLGDVNAKSKRRRRKSSTKSQRENSADDGEEKNRLIDNETIICDKEQEEKGEDNKQDITIEKTDLTKKCTLSEIETNDSTVDKTDNSKVSLIKNDAIVDEKSKSIDKTRKCHIWVHYLKSLDIDEGIFYNVSQMFVFGIMAMLIMRLKLLFTPHLCIVASLAAKPTYYSKVLKRHRGAVMFVAIAILSMGAFHGYKNFLLERSYIGEFYDPPLEQLLRWVGERTASDAVVAAPMPLASAVVLSTRRAVVLHPQYEHAKLRQRAYSVYKAYGRFSPLDLHAEMSKLKVTHLLLDLQNCYGKSAMGCTFEDIWDHEVPSLRGWPKLCHRLVTEDVPHFYKVFQNERYAAFRVHDVSVRYTPRLLDT